MTSSERNERSFFAKLLVWLSSKSAQTYAFFAAALVLTFPSIGPIKFFNPLDFYDSDNSWIYSINYAVSEGLVFGRDIIFSYGPLSAFVLPLDLAQHVEIAAVFQLSIQVIWL